MNRPHNLGSVQVDHGIEKIPARRIEFREEAVFRVRGTQPADLRGSTNWCRKLEPIACRTKNVQFAICIRFDRNQSVVVWRTQIRGVANRRIDYEWQTRIVLADRKPYLMFVPP